MEQHALLYLKNPVPMVRKYAFHLTMAGKKYQEQKYLPFAIRCYIIVSQIYNKGHFLIQSCFRGWSGISINI